jgi:hypothetical protein
VHEKAQTELQNLHPRFKSGRRLQHYWVYSGHTQETASAGTRNIGGFKRKLVSSMRTTSARFKHSSISCWRPTQVFALTAAEGVS